MKPTLAKTYDGQAVSGWLMSEKLDGVRAIWDGEKLISRNGNVFPAPAWFLAQLPTGVMLDGELFMGRGRFQETVGRVRSGKGWEQIRFHVFDAPAASGGFESRLAYAAGAVAGVAVAEIVPHVRCEGLAHMERYLAGVINLGGEGIMLRNPSAPYRQGRTSDLLKYKMHSCDEGKVTSRMQGAVAASWRGMEIVIPCKREMPSIGQLITFAFHGLTDSGCPRFASFVGVRDYE